MAKDSPEKIRFALAQLNPLVGDIDGNAGMARKARAEAAKKDADAIVFSELFITGYPPEDLILKPAFIAAARQAVETLARETGDGGPAVLIGTPWAEDGEIYNSVAYLDEGRVAAVRHKVELPNYGVFDEKRVFAAGPLPGPINLRGVRVGEVALPGPCTSEELPPRALQEAARRKGTSIQRVALECQLLKTARGALMGRLGRLE